MEPTPQLVVNPASGHLLQGHCGCLFSGFIPRAPGDIEQQVESRGMGELGLCPEASVMAVEFLQRRGHHLVHDLHAETARVAGKVFVVFNRRHHAARRFHDLVAARLPRLYHAAQHPLEAGPAVAVVAGKIRSPKERLALRSQHRGQGPPVLSADGGHRGLVARIHIRPLIAIHLHRDEILVNHSRQLRILITLPIHHMAPVAPHSSNIEQDGLVFPRRAGKGLGSPLMPLNRLMHGGAQIRGGSFGEGVSRLCHLL